ncbi:serine/threonine protein phosphatase [Trypanosoma cruzi Dm28c]|uniref:Serine/threonine protein phosphatase n=1 Tax=Trypanosoma cruzi Dm28c TaxID=1416333 RepID=V5ARY9_TRYCR|nr:serine/threonine protein phosphatase [Trypanosoma cruzi Dm28c]
MDTQSAVLSQLRLLKLSNGARVVDSVQRPESAPTTSVAAALKDVMGGRGLFNAVPQQADTVKAGNSGRGSNTTSPMTLVTGSAGSSSHPSTSELKLVRGNQGSATATGGGGGGGKTTRNMRPTPRSLQQPMLNQEKEKETVTPAQSPNNALKQLLQAVSSTTISTSRDAGSSSFPVAIALTNVEPSAVRMSTLVAGTAADPRLLEPIDNFNAQKPIIRTAPPCEHRYIVVGDVHGCPEQLEKLMLKVNYQKGKDCLILAGDLVNKGPDSIGAVRVAQKLGAIGVLGNHDSTLLNCIARCRKPKLTVQEELDPVMQLALSFPQGCQDYLRSLPHILRIPKYNVIVVHAGLNLNNSIENQDVFEIMHMRRLEKIGGSEDKKARTITKAKWKAVVKGTRGEPWAEHWKGPEFVVFGHDARSGLQEHPFAYGIDTGCVYGSELTCVVYGPDSPKGTLVSVPGLPKFTNEERGLPPPAAPVYEQYIEDMERQILRPTSRATPSVVTNDYKPTFLSVPPTTSSPATSSTFLGASGGCANGKTISKHCGVERATLLSLSQAGELTAVNTLMSLPIYEAAWMSMLNNEAEDCTSTFWIPFVQGILTKLLNVSAEFPMDCVDDVLQLALEVCDELETVRKIVAPQLHVLLTREGSGAISLSKATMKLLRLITMTQQ